MEYLIMAAIAYFCGVFITGATGLAGYLDEFNTDAQRRAGALLFFKCWMWPIMLTLYLDREVIKMYRFAFRKEARRR